MKKPKKLKGIIAFILAFTLISSSALSIFATDEAAPKAAEEPAAAEETVPDTEESKEEAVEAKEEPSEEPKEDPKEATEEPVIIEETETEAVPFKADKADFLAYDPLYIAKYANPAYVDASDVDLTRYYDIVTAAKGIATYNVKKQGEFDVTEKNFIAGLTYEMPVYNIDDSSKYYVAIPNINKFNSNFAAYDLDVAYNNDYAEMITGYKYEKGILYIPKSAVDSPKNKHDVPDGCKVAVQLNYAIGGDMDFSKDIPVQVLSGDEPKDLTLHTSNIFDRDLVTVKTGVKGRKAEDIGVYLNGSLIPANEDGWEYDKSSGELSIDVAPGVVSGINVVFEKRTVKEAAKDIATSAIEAVTPASYAAVSMDDMSYFKDENGKPIELDIRSGDIFVGWRGYYNGQYTHNSSEAWYNRVSEYPGWKNSVSYLYGGYVEGATTGVGAADATWAISSYATAYDMSPSTNYGSLTKDEQVSHDGETMTIYEWLLKYRNYLEKSRLVYGGGVKWNKGTGLNGIGGYNNFALTLPKKVNGADTSLVSSGDDTDRANSDITFNFKGASGGTSAYYNYWIAASCNHLDSAEVDDGDDAKDSSIYVTCLGVGKDYVVLAFVQSRSTDNQNACAIYKFKAKTTGYAKLKKVSANTSITG